MSRTFRTPQMLARRGSPASVLDDNVRVSDSGSDQNHRKDIHPSVADLIGDCKGCRRQHEMRQDFHAAFREHEISYNDAQEACHCHKVIDGNHFAAETLGLAPFLLRPFPLLDSDVAELISEGELVGQVLMARSALRQEDQRL
jgi:hypothetical protein